MMSIICITRVECYELINVELMGKNDPYVMFKIGTVLCIYIHIL